MDMMTMKQSRLSSQWLNSIRWRTDGGVGCPPTIVSRSQCLAGAMSLGSATLNKSDLGGVHAPLIRCR